MNFFAILNNRRGQRHLDQTGDLDRAATAFERAIRHAEDWSVPWYNLGLVRKLQRRWPESLDCNLRATALDPTDQAAWWNAGIAATALGEWPTARLAWESFGITLSPGEGEIVMRLGLTPIRLNPSANGEVVWCQRIDPARAVVRNVPLPNSGYRYGDLLLHDGAPNGSRMLRGEEVPVFDAIQLLKASPYRTYAVRVRAGSADAVQALAEQAESNDCGIEDWDTIRRLCASCSVGNPDPYAANPQYAERQVVELAIAARSDENLRSLLMGWASAHPGSETIDITLLTPGAAPTN
jgi:hypothetical protein